MSVVSAAVGGIIAVSSGIITINGADRPTTKPVTIDAALEEKTNPVALDEERLSPAPLAPTKPTAVRTPSPKPSTRAPRAPRPVSGLSQAQMNNAAVIVQVAQERGFPRRAMLVAMMTGLQESSLRNLANPTVPGSLDQPNEGSGANFDSLGVFQQRPSQGWGTVAQLMDPNYAADVFYERLFKVSNWETKSLGDAAQAVQRSAAPDAYAAHEKRAIEVLDALL